LFRSVLTNRGARTLDGAEIQRSYRLATSFGDDQATGPSFEENAQRFSEWGAAR